MKVCKDRIKTIKTWKSKRLKDRGLKKQKLNKRPKLHWWLVNNNYKIAKQDVTDKNSNYKARKNAYNSCLIFQIIVLLY